jgi:glycosyltransferase involved in cell wall biosynthesis
MEVNPEAFIHTGVDDPQGFEVYDDLVLNVKTNYRDLYSDIIIVILPPCDQILNAIQRCAYVSLQLSIREGYEVKVTESIYKNVPVIAYKAGGIPLQIKHGFNGYLVDIGDYEQVAEHLYDLFANHELYSNLVANCSLTNVELHSNVSNCLNWFSVFNQL